MAPIIRLFLIFLVFLINPWAQAEVSIQMSPLYIGSFPKVAFYATIRLKDLSTHSPQKSDFLLYEDEQEILDFSLTLQKEPAEVAIILDASGSVKSFTQLIRNGAQRFVDQLLPGDKASIITFNNRVKLIQPMTADREELSRAIQGIQVYGGTRLYDGIHRGLKSLKEGRRFAVLFTDGQDMKYPTDTKRFSRRSLEEAIQLARKNNIPVFGIGVGDSIDSKVLNTLCSSSGGKFFESPEPGAIPAIYEEISSWIRNRYLVAYNSPKDQNHSEWRTVQMKEKNTSIED